MKRKLSLLLTMILAMTMVMGTGVTAFADWFTIDINGTSNYESGYLTISGDGIKAIVENAGDGCTYERYDDLYSFSLPLSGPTMNGSTAEYIWDKGTHDSYKRSGDYSDIVSFKWNATSKIGTIEMYTVSYCIANGLMAPSPIDPPTPCEPAAPAHTHDFRWQTITEPTKDSDGLEGEVCSCGAMRNTQLLSAYGYALNEYAAPMINAAKPGQTVTLEFGEFNSFPKSFMAKLVDKSAQNVTFVFKYKWNHETQTITIPAGTPIDLNFDWYGPAKMAELYGNN